MKRFEALKEQTKPLLNQMAARPVARRQSLLKMVGVPKRVPVPFHNKKGRQFYLTLKGKFVIRTATGKSLYGRKATDHRAPKAIRPKRILT